MKHRKKNRKDKKRQPERSSTPIATVPKARIDKAVRETSQFLSSSLKNITPIGQQSFKLDEWQAEAVRLLQEGHNVIVDAPTTAGKTAVVESFLESQQHDPNFSAVYTTPVKSLSNDKLLEFREKYGQNYVGIATGDKKENLDAPLVVSTLESFRNSLLGVGETISKSLVIFDEYHFLQDPSRGSAWEETIILNPRDCQILMLSASVANAAAFAKWIEKIKKRPCQVVSTSHRPVPLENLVFFGGKWILPSSIHLPKKNPKDERWRFPAPQKEVAESLKLIESMKLTPCIVYSSQRLSCENLAVELTNHINPISKEVRSTLSEKLTSLIRKFEAAPFINQKLRSLITNFAIAYHHSGLGPPARLVIEALLKNGELRYCTATMGLSIGINFSVRSAMVSDYRRPGADGFTQYSSSEILQMLGRAGRRGRDRVGFSLWPNHQSLQKFIPANRKNTNSQLRSDPHTFLGLVGRGFKLTDIERFYRKSFLAESSHPQTFQLLTKKYVTDTIGHCNLCRSPAREWAHRHDREVETCANCIRKMENSPEIQKIIDQPLSRIHIHLHHIECLDEDEQLTNFGSLARFFPQNGGLLLAKLFSSEELGVNTMGAATQLMAALSVAFFKQPRTRPDYDFPFIEGGVNEELEYYYPYEIFPELYDPPFGSRHYPVFREFNPDGGYIAQEWLRGGSWQHLVQSTCHAKFHQGDLTNCLYRTATYLQSLSQSPMPELRSMAKKLWQQAIRPPLTLVSEKK